MTFNGQEYTSTKDVVDIAPTDHDWGEPVWNWSEDGKSATVTFTCQNDNTHTQSPEVTITSEVKTPATCTEMGTTIYTAKATFNGQEYTSTKDVADIAKLSHTLKKTNRVEATCTTAGKEAYYTCESCGKHFSDAKGKNEITKFEEYGIIPATEHKAGTEWKHNETGHWNECMNNCGETLNKAAHTFEWVVDKEATATEAGSKHERCTVCGYEKATVGIPATCGETLNKAAHTFEWVVDKEATATEAGSKHERCTVCGYEKATVGIPATGADIPQTGDNSHLLVWIMLALLSGGAVLTLSIRNRKKKESVK